MYHISYVAHYTKVASISTNQIDINPILNKTILHVSF